MTQNIHWHKKAVTQQDKEKRHGHKGFALWFTGLSGSGKSTIANEIEKRLFQQGMTTSVLDGDNIRLGLNGDLGFSQADRQENIRRIAEVAKLFTESGIVVLVPVISPYSEDRKKARDLFEKGKFIEVYVDCPLDVCQQRDPKGLYSKAKKNEVMHFTGIDAPYEEPKSPEIVLNTNLEPIDVSVGKIYQYLASRKLLKD